MISPNLKDIERIKVNVIINRQLLTMTELKTLVRAIDWANKQNYLAPQYRDMEFTVKTILKTHGLLFKIRSGKLKLVA